MKKFFVVLLVLTLFCFSSYAQADEKETGSIMSGNSTVEERESFLDYLFSSMADGAHVYVWNDEMYWVVTFTDSEYLYVQSEDGTEEWKIETKNADEYLYTIFWER